MVWKRSNTCFKLPELFLVASDPDISVAKAYDLETRCRDIHFKRAFGSSEFEMWEGLMSLLEAFVIGVPTREQILIPQGPTELMPFALLSVGARNLLTIYCFSVTLLFSYGLLRQSLGWWWSPPLSIHDFLAWLKNVSNGSGEFIW